MRATLSSAIKPKSLHSVYLKIFFNYLQLVVLTASFNLEWPELVLSLFRVQERAGTVSDQVLSFDCILYEYSIGLEGVYYEKLVIMSFLPIGLILVAMIF